MRLELIQSHIDNEWTPTLTTMMIELAEGVASHKMFKYVREKDDLVQNGLVYLLKIWKKFDVEHASANPFGYFTQSLFREYVKIYTRETKRNSRFVQMIDDGDYDHDSY